MAATKWVIRSGFGIFYSFPDSNTINNTVATVPFVATQTVIQRSAAGRRPRAPGPISSWASRVVAANPRGRMLLRLRGEFLLHAGRRFRIELTCTSTYVSNGISPSSTSSRLHFVRHRLRGQQDHAHEPEHRDQRPAARTGPDSGAAAVPAMGSLHVRHFSKRTPITTPCRPSSKRATGTALNPSLLHLLQVHRFGHPAGRHHQSRLLKSIAASATSICRTPSPAASTISCLSARESNSSAARGIVNQIVSGWALAGIVTLRSGLPFTPTICGDIANTGVGSQRPDVIGVP